MQHPTDLLRQRIYTMAPSINPFPIFTTDEDASAYCYEQTLEMACLIERTLKRLSPEDQQTIVDNIFNIFSKYLPYEMSDDDDNDPDNTGMRV